MSVRVLARLFMAFLIGQSMVPRPAFALDWFGETLAGVACVGLGQGFGPYDYFEINDPSGPLYKDGRLWEINPVHFDVAQRAFAAEPFEQGNLQIAANEFDYTLRAIPTHPGALMSVIDLDAKIRRLNQVRTVKLVRTIPPPECYFQRAIAFRPKVSQVRILYGVYLHRLKLYEKALGQYRIAESLAPGNAELLYNIGLCYFDLKNLSQARAYAKRAYDMGYPLPGLRQKLQQSGAW